LKDQPQGRTLCLEGLKTIDTEATYGAEIRTDASSPSADEFSEFLIQQSAKSAKRVGKGLLSILSPPRLKVLQKYDPSLKREE
jgi:hypothetical protein